MSYTNQTQHYGLPQYVGTDVPAWLTDVNGAFAAIDTGMNAAKVQADSAATAAGQAANDITALQSTVGTQATQISAAAQAAATAQSTANGADTKAAANAQAISGLDTRVEALEQGGSGALTVTETTHTNITFTTSGAAAYATIPMSSILPSGKTYADIVSIEFFPDDAQSPGAVFSGVTPQVLAVYTFAGAVTIQSGRIVVVTK